MELVMDAAFVVVVRLGKQQMRFDSVQPQYLVDITCLGQCMRHQEPIHEGSVGRIMLGVALRQWGVGHCYYGYDGY